MDLTPYVFKDIIQFMNWTVLLHDDFADELTALDQKLQDELLAHAKLLAEFGPNLGRPTVDTLKGTSHANMKEMRFNWMGEAWRVAFKDHAIMLDHREIIDFSFYQLSASLD